MFHKEKMDLVSDHRGRIQDQREARGHGTGPGRTTGGGTRGSEAGPEGGPEGTKAGQDQAGPEGTEADKTRQDQRETRQDKTRQDQGNEAGPEGKSRGKPGHRDSCTRGRPQRDGLDQRQVPEGRVGEAVCIRGQSSRPEGASRGAVDPLSSQSRWEGPGPSVRGARARIHLASASHMSNAGLGLYVG